MSIILSDSRCTQDLHANVVELQRLTGHSSINKPANTREFFLHLATLTQSIERVSRRIDGEVAARAELVSIVLDLIDQTDPLQVSKLRARLAQLI